MIEEVLEDVSGTLMVVPDMNNFQPGMYEAMPKFNDWDDVEEDGEQMKPKNAGVWTVELSDGIK